MNTTLPSTTATLDRPGGRTMSEDGDSSDNSSTKIAGHDANSTDTINGLALESVLEPDIDDEDPPDGVFEIE